MWEERTIMARSFVKLLYKKKKKKIQRVGLALVQL